MPQVSSHTCPGMISYLLRSVVITFPGVFSGPGIFSTCLDVFSSEPNPSPSVLSYFPMCVLTLPQLTYMPRYDLVLAPVCCRTFPGVFLSCPGYSVFSFLPRCVLIPTHYQLVDFLAGYLPVCVSMFVCYGKILVVAWRQRQRIEPVVNVNLARGSASPQAMAGAVSQRGDATGTDNSQHPPEHAPSGTSFILVVAKDLISVSLTPVI